MAEQNDILEQHINKDYEWGFITDIDSDTFAKGLNEDVVKGWRDGIPLKRGGTTDDVANACLFFASDMSAFVTGQVLNVCGGMLT